MEFLPDGRHAVTCKMHKRHAQPTAPEPYASLQSESSISPASRTIEPQSATREQISIFSPNQITAWKAQLESGAADVFGAGGGQTAQPAVDVKTLHAKIGELTLENDFLEGALNKAGLLSAKR